MSEEIRQIRPGSYVIHKNQPYQVMKNQIVVTGTHSHTKNRLDLKALFSGQNESVVLPPHDRLNTVEILRKKAQVISKSPLQIMDLVSYETFEAQADKESVKDILECDEVTYVEFNGARIILEKRS